MKYFCFCQGDVLLTKEHNIPLDISLLDLRPWNFVTKFEWADESCQLVRLDNPVTSDDFIMMPLRKSFDVLPVSDYQLAGKCAELLYFDQNSKYCGCCGAPMKWQTEISKQCTNWGKELWPQLQTAVIVRITRGSGEDEEILMVHGRNFRGQYYGLVAGFVETGETLEEAGEPVFFDKAPEIRINDVRFAYEGQTAPVFDGFSCIFRAGEITEVTGPTGVGKSTLIRLVLALLKPSSGEVLIEGRPVSAATRCNCMYVPQGNSLMSGTIRDNLLMADADADEEAMRRALHLAAADFVLELPEGLDARCGETGSGLSEGQSQRIAVARALLCPGNVLILDEATSALDVETEKVLLKNLRDFCRGEKTVIFISHRESVASICDAAVRL